MKITAVNKKEGTGYFSLHAGATALKSNLGISIMTLIKS